MRSHPDPRCPCGGGGNPGIGVMDGPWYDVAFFSLKTEVVCGAHPTACRVRLDPSPKPAALTLPPSGWRAL